jgi:SsrA-binding protein
MTLIPARIYTKGNLIKVSVALGKGKKEYDKRETIKKRDMQRAVEKELLGNK